LVVGYEEFSLHQADLLVNASPYPRDSFEEFDRLIRQRMPEHTCLDYYPEPPQVPEDQYFDLKL